MKIMNKYDIMKHCIDNAIFTRNSWRIHFPENESMQRMADAYDGLEDVDISSIKNHEELWNLLNPGEISVGKPIQNGTECLFCSQCGKESTTVSFSAGGYTESETCICRECLVKALAMIDEKSEK